jgi:hypothetical protein
MKIADYLDLLDDAERRMTDAFQLLATRHAAHADIRDTAKRLATWSLEKRASLGYAIETYGRARSTDTDRIYDTLFRPRPGGFGLLRDLHDASLLVHHVYLCWTGVAQGAKALADHQLVDLCEREIVRTERQARWLRTQVKVTAPQALTVKPEKVSLVRSTLQSVKPRLALAGAGVALLAVGTLGAVTAIARRR